ncbi:MAG: hypothetical protein M3217_01320 [Actinomycetota bacterium]|nr:hypothetical protein [Actinomycetota bacterium]
MSFEDRLRNLVRRAEEGMPPAPAVSWEETIMKARRDRAFYLTAVATAAAVIVGVATLSAAALLRERDSGPRRPAAPATTEPTSGPPATPTPAGEPTCPAAGLSATPEEQAELAPPVAATRAEIVEAAVACDYDRLGRIIEVGGQPEFTFSFGDEATLEAFVASLRRSNGETLDVLVQTLDLPYCSQRVEGRLVYQWPSAFCEGATDADWDALRALYSDEEIAAWREFGSFAGHRVGIDGDGAWLFFVSGE